MNKQQEYYLKLGEFIVKYEKLVHNFEGFSDYLFQIRTFAFVKSHEEKASIAKNILRLTEGKENLYVIINLLLEEFPENAKKVFIPLNDEFRKIVSFRNMISHSFYYRNELSDVESIYNPKTKEHTTFDKLSEMVDRSNTLFESLITSQNNIESINYIEGILIINFKNL
jgi:hypothetical protein